MNSVGLTKVHNNDVSPHLLCVFDVQRIPSNHATGSFQIRLVDPTSAGLSLNANSTFFTVFLPGAPISVSKPNANFYAIGNEVLNTVFYLKPGVFKS